MRFILSSILIIIFFSCQRENHILQYPQPIKDNGLEVVYDNARWFYYLNYFEYQCIRWTTENEKDIKNKNVSEYNIELTNLQIKSDTVNISLGLFLNDTLECYAAMANQKGTAGYLINQICLSKRTKEIYYFKTEDLLHIRSPFFDKKFLKKREEDMSHFLIKNKSKLKINPWLLQEAKRRKLL